jgi:hypothetical protein
VPNNPLLERTAAAVSFNGGRGSRVRRRGRLMALRYLVMGYELRITRAEPAGPITLDEWLAIVDADPQMQREGAAESSASSGIIRYESPGLAKWNSTWFDFRRGRIFVKNPSEDDITKMKQLAHLLNSIVVGDEGEEY